VNLEAAEEEEDIIEIEKLAVMKKEVKELDIEENADNMMITTEKEDHTEEATEEEDSEAKVAEADTEVVILEEAIDTTEVSMRKVNTRKVSAKEESSEADIEEKAEAGSEVKVEEADTEVETIY